MQTEFLRAQFQPSSQAGFHTTIDSKLKKPGLRGGGVLHRCFPSGGGVQAGEKSETLAQNFFL
jgi:hypothetical protein